MRSISFPLDTSFSALLTEQSIIAAISLAVNPILIQAPLPGGATATTINQLRDMGMLDKFPALIASMKEVQKQVIYECGENYRPAFSYDNGLVGILDVAE